jgi:FtsP/CotA-like multicopper oxidase with cupredoxin domain
MIPGDPQNPSYPGTPPAASATAYGMHPLFGAVISRRRALTAGLGIGAAMLWAGRSLGAGDMLQHGSASLSAEAANPTSIPQESAPLIDPEVRRSAGGQLRTKLRVRYAYQEIGGYRLNLRTYDGMTPGPTLRARPGDVLRIRLVNELPPNRDSQPDNHNLPNHLNTTNLHVHGMHVSPEGLADNVLREMEPGQAYDVEIPIPASHPSGTYWYHPHRHGSANVQVASGMAGALIIEGDFADVPQITQARDRVLILQQIAFDALGTVESFDTVWPMQAARLFTVNGQLRPTITMRPGEVQRWRVIHAGFHDSTPIGLDQHELHEIAADGIALPGVRTQASILVVPGQRTDVLVKAGAPGTYALRSLPFNQGEGDNRTWVLANVVVSGDPMPMDLPAALPPVPLAAIRTEELTGTRKITFSTQAPATGGDDFREFRFMIDHRLFDHRRIDHRIRLGAVEEWEIVNLDEADHPFHIHTNPFLVTRINGAAVAEPIWRDTVNVRGHGSVTMRSRFEDFTGLFVLHCHIFNHEDIGMMQLVEVYKGGDSPG